MTRPYAIIENCFPQEVLEDFEIAKQFWNILPDADASHPSAVALRRRLGDKETERYFWSCHGVCRGVLPFLKLDWTVFDGFFGRVGNCHAWLWVRYGQASSLIDLYPIGAASGPILLDMAGPSPWQSVYSERRMYYGTEEIAKFEWEGLEAANAYREAIATS